MQLDRTHVRIRARSLPEIGDLALILVRRYPGALLKGFCLGALPWAVFNALLLGWIPINDAIDGIVDEQTILHRLRYVWLMALLVFLQTPIAGALTTYYIGQAVFEQRPPWRDVIASCRAAAWPSLWVLGIVRGPIPAMLLLATNWGEPFAPGRELVWMLLILFAAAALRSVRPFLPEIILLERCPLRSGRVHRGEGNVTVRRRSALLHAPISGDLMGRFLAVALVLAFLTGAIFYALMFVRGILTATWDWSAFVLLVLVPLALWTVAGLSVLIRFLCYLDARIRLEGWEVELALRAEALRQFGSEGPSVATVQHPGAAGGGRSSRPAASLVRVGGAVCLLAVVSTGVARGQAPARGAAAEGTRDALAAAEAKSHQDRSGRSRPEGQAAEALRSLGRNPWYDPQSDQLQPVAVQPVQDDTVNRNSRWLPKPDKIVRPAAPLPAMLPGGLSFGNLVGWLLLVGLFVAIVSLLVYAFSRIDREPDLPASVQSRGPQETSPEELAARMEQLPEELRGQVADLRSEAERLMNSGRFDRAIICLFGHQLLQLDRHQMIRLARGKTNRQYLREAARHGQLADILRETVHTFEASYFGRHTIAAERFEGLWQQNLRLEQMLQTHREEAAA